MCSIKDAKYCFGQGSVCTPSFVVCLAAETLVELQIGQFFAARAEFVPEPICKKLSLLHDQVQSGSGLNNACTRNMPRHVQAQRSMLADPSSVPTRRPTILNGGGLEASFYAMMLADS